MASRKRKANTVPGLTPSTVLYHQALAETPPISPAAFLTLGIELAAADGSGGSGYALEPE